jgi:xanthine/CO dehydrogenase XdhC/CoxF family maturation factor
MADATVDRLVCPIGLTTIQHKAPAAIAASVAAQVLIAREALQARKTNGDHVSDRVRHG